MASLVGVPSLDHHKVALWRLGLGYESKCWAGFDSRFDMLTRHIGADDE